MVEQHVGRLMLILPFAPSIPNQTFTTFIEGEEYRFGARWNGRGGQWFMEVFTADGTPIIRSVPIVLGVYLGGRSTHKLFRAGLLIALDMTRTGTEATLDDLGTRVAVRYYPHAEAITRLATTGAIV